MAYRAGVINYHIYSIILRSLVRTQNQNQINLSLVSSGSSAESWYLSMRHLLACRKGKVTQLHAKPELKSFIWIASCFATGQEYAYWGWRKLMNINKNKMIIFYFLPRARKRDPLRLWQMLHSIVKSGCGSGRALTNTSNKRVSSRQSSVQLNALMNFSLHSNDRGRGKEIPGYEWITLLTVQNSFTVQADIMIVDIYFTYLQTQSFCIFSLHLQALYLIYSTESLQQDIVAW